MFNKTATADLAPDAVMVGKCFTCQRVFEVKHHETERRQGWAEDCAECPGCHATVPMTPKPNQLLDEVARKKPPKDLMESFKWAVLHVSEKYRDSRGNVVCYHCLATLSTAGEKVQAGRHRADCPYTNAQQVLARYSS